MSITYTFLGDSITCSNRFFDEDHHGLGDGYVYHLFQILSQSDSNSDRAIACVNKGYDGLTASALSERLQNGSITLSGSVPACSTSKDPSHENIILLIGINDVGISKNTGCPLSVPDLTATISKLLDLLLSHSNNVTCFSPFLFPYPEEFLTWMEDLHTYIQVLQQECQTRNIPFYDLQEYFKDLSGKYQTSELTYDGIHLTEKGHELLAEYMLCRLR